MNCLLGRCISAYCLSLFIIATLPDSISIVVFATLQPLDCHCLCQAACLFSFSFVVSVSLPAPVPVLPAFASVRLAVWYVSVSLAVVEASHSKRCMCIQDKSRERKNLRRKELGRKTRRQSASCQILLATCPRYPRFSFP